MKNLIPHFIQSQFKENQSHGGMEAYTMFIDLSGFTPLTEGLMREGNKGAEQLSIILNEIFSPLVSMVYAQRGFIPYFAGDAFTAIFPAEGGKIDTPAFINAALLVRHLFEEREFQFGEFIIGIKIGLSYGKVEWGIVGTAPKTFYFRGPAIDQAAICHIKAKHFDRTIVLDEALRKKIDQNSFKLGTIEEGYYCISEAPEVKAISTVNQNLPALEEEILSQFLPNSVVKYQQEGEFRTVISLFISFRGIDNHEMMNEFANIVLEQIINFSGYFKEIDFGDKGGVVCIFFGAPVSFENNIERALEFITAVTREIDVMPNTNKAEFKAGITNGTAYTGIVGGKERCQYAAVGNQVNLGARLMTYADWGEVLVDAEIQKTKQFRFQHKGDIKYKGIEGPVPTFKLLGRAALNQQAYEGSIVGRGEELDKIWRFAQPLLEGKPTGIAYIYGEAGIGKSRFTHELRQMLQGSEQIAWFTCQADQILKKPFNPFIYFLRNYFKQSAENASVNNTKNFELVYEVLLERLRNALHADRDRVGRELIRTKPILAALIGLDYADSLWDQLNAKGRYQNTIAAIINLILAESIIQPLVLELEDGHWFDDNSKELLLEFVRQMRRYPILVLVNSRYRDDGAKPAIIHPALLESFNIQRLEFDLNILPPEATKHFAEINLKGKIGKEFQELLVRTTNGNPFYLEQVLEYFSESNLLEIRDGEWTIKDKNIRLSSSINAILTARIDRLSSLVKETVKAAAVIGREFEVPVLNEVMKVQEVFIKRNGNANVLLKEQIQKAEKGQIWLAMNELRYIFRHSLLREAVYSMQLRTRLQQLHQLIAQAIERLYAEKMEERYFDLAFHYEQAGVFDKTCEYLRKAADYARSNYQNQQALEYYEKLLKKLSSQEDKVHEIKTHLKKGKVLELIGKWDECKMAYEQALIMAKQARDVVLLGQANNSLGRLLMLKGDYGDAKNYLRTAAGLFESIDDKDGIGEVYGSLGNLYFRQGEYDEAKSYFERSIETGQHSGNSTSFAQIVANLGLTYMNQGQYDAGISCQMVQLEICGDRNDKQGMATLHTNMGIVYFEKGDYEAALDSYEKGLELSEELGNKLLTSIAIGCIGSVYERKGAYDKAMENFQRDLELCEELGDKQGIAIALGLIGELLSIKGDFHQAIEYLQKNLMLCEELGYQKGIGKAVNTLGDVFYYTGQYERSLHYYNRAIEVSRRIGNKLVLGFSLVEKGRVLLEIDAQDELAVVNKEAIEIAERLGNPDLVFHAKVLGAKTHLKNGNRENATTALQKLVATELNPEQEANIYFELFKIDPEEKNYKNQALEIYQKLYQATPKYNYKTRIEQLTD